MQKPIEAAGASVKPFRKIRPMLPPSPDRAYDDVADRGGRRPMFTYDTVMRPEYGLDHEVLRQRATNRDGTVVIVRTGAGSEGVSFEYNAPEIQTDFSVFRQADGGTPHLAVSFGSLWHRDEFYAMRDLALPLRQKIKADIIAALVSWPDDPAGTDRIDFQY